MTCHAGACHGDAIHAVDKLIEGARQRGDVTGAREWYLAAVALIDCERRLCEARKKQTWHGCEPARTFRIPRGVELLK